MASCFEMVDKEYIEELKDKSEKLMKTRRIARGGERTFSKSGRMKETCNLFSTNDCCSFFLNKA